MPSSSNDPAVYSAERLQKRNRNIVPPGIFHYAFLLAEFVIDENRPINAQPATIDERGLRDNDALRGLLSPLNLTGAPACRSRTPRKFRRTSSRRTCRRWLETSSQFARSSSFRKPWKEVYCVRSTSNPERTGK